ncbi:MAG: MTH938/NDUFAF3 family protein [Elusimicrobiota bacterium]
MQIEFYDFGEIVINGKKYNSDVIIYPDTVQSSWWRKQGHSLCVDDLNDVISAKPEIIIVGTGYSGCMTIPVETKKQIENQNIKLIVENTKKATELHNKLQNKNVITCLHLTC